MSSAKVARFKLNLLNLSRYLLMSCASLSFVPAWQKMRGVTPHFNLNGRCYYRYTKRKKHRLSSDMPLAYKQECKLHTFKDNSILSQKI